MNEEKKIPAWEILTAFGLPLNSRNDVSLIPDYKTVFDNIIIASRYLAGPAVRKDRYYESFKALLISLRIHYPAEFSKIEKASGLNLSESFQLDEITGRDIKLRNISLALISSYYKAIKGL